MWGTSSWNWGSAIGDAHDAAAVLRQKLRSDKARSDYILSLKRGGIDDWLEVQLCLALVWQRRRPEAFMETYETLISGGYSTSYDMAQDMAKGLERFCLNVRLDVKPERLEEFLKTIKINEAGTRTEPKNIRYSWGHSTTEPTSFHFQEQFCGQSGFDQHASSPHFSTWEAFAQTEPFTKPPQVEFWIADTNLAHEEPPCVVAAAVLATLDFVPSGFS